MWGILWGSLLKLCKLCWLSNFCNVFFIFSAHFLSAIYSEVPGPIDFKFYVRHPGVGVYHTYGNYVNSAIVPFLPIFLHFFSPIFKCYLLRSLWTDWLQISCEASWGGFLVMLWKLCWLSIVCIFCIFFIIFFQSNFQMLSCLKFLDWLTSNCMWGILVGRVSTKVMEIMLMHQFCQQSIKVHGPLVFSGFTFKY